MKRIYFYVSEETYKLLRLMDDHRLKGRIWLENQDGRKIRRFEPYQHTSKRTTRMLYRTPFGWLGDTAHNVKLHLLAPKNVGWHRVADLLLGDTKESTDALHQMADGQLKDELLNSEENE
ncbi:MAG: hypothetical protein J6Z14_04620 [Prevotella sp.]|nr:hypothetical protein [Prevotella sp.]